MASMFNLAAVKNTFDEVRAQVYPRNETEKKVYEALSSKNWGASSTMLNELANDTYDYEKYRIITEIVWNNLNTDGKNWRQVFKTLTFIDFLIKNGAERFIEDCRDRMNKIRQLQDYNFYEDNIDRGSGVREKSKQLIDLLGNNEHIRDEREKARALRNKFVGIDSRNTGGGGGGYGGNSYGGNNYGGQYGGNYSSSGVDSYSSGGRYDSHDTGSRYGGQGSDSYGNQQRRNNEYSNNTTSSQPAGGRYGGGAYDSSRPNRYDDDVQEPEPELEEAKVVKNSSASKTTTGSKLKVSIKKSTAAPSVAAKQPEVDLMPAADIDLLGGFESAPATGFQAAIADFDPFASAPAPVGAAADFDPFGSSFAPVPSAQPAYNQFSAAPAAPPAGSFAAFPPAGQASMPAYTSYAPAPAPAPAAAAVPMNFMPQSAPMMPMNNFPVSQTMSAPNMMPPKAQPQAQPAAYAPQYHATQHDADFGEFEAAPQSRANTASNQWGDLNKLVDLGKLEKNDVAVPKQQQPKSSSSGHDSFAGLDGFSKTPQSMSAVSGRPMMMSSQPAMMNRSQPMGAPMGVMNAPMNMNGGGMMAPAYGMMPPNNGGYGAPMGAGAPMNMYGNAPMGGMYNPNMGAPAAGFGSAPGFSNQQGPMGGYPQNYGMPQYRG